MAAALLTKGLDAPAEATPAIPVKLAPEGLVTAIVAVTGVVDAVGDLIVPGAFAYTLTVRRPKVVFQHQWTEQVGRVLHVEEWMPGDSRLPTLTKDGKPWPAAAGALVATMQFNMRSPRAAEQWEMVRFYAETHEAEFSIGYKVPDGKARKRRDGVRVILQVDLYEFSHVLFGAAPLSMALDVKSAVGMSSASGGAVTVPTLGSEEETEFADTTPPHVDTTTPWDETEEKVSAAWAANEGNPENLRKWFAAGADGAIAWGSPGDFDACVAIASKHMSPEQAKGYCNLRHHDAMGIYPATHAKLEAKTAMAVLLDAGATITPAIEEKSMTYMTGSQEERQQLLRDAARDLFCNTTPEVGEAPGDDDDRAWVCVRATFDTEVIVTVEKDGDETSYLVPYEVTDGGVDLGEPTEVELSVVAKVAGEPEVESPTENDQEAIAGALEGQIMSNLIQVKALAAIAGVTSDALRAQATALLIDLGGKAMPEPDADQAGGPSDGDTDNTDAEPDADQAGGPSDADSDNLSPAPAKTSPWDRAAAAAGDSSAPEPTADLSADAAAVPTDGPAADVPMDPPPTDAPSDAPATDAAAGDGPPPGHEFVQPYDDTEQKAAAEEPDADENGGPSDGDADNADTATEPDADQAGGPSDGDTDNGRVTVNPDDHFALLDSLGDPQDDKKDPQA